MNTSRWLYVVSIACLGFFLSNFGAPPLPPPGAISPYLNGVFPDQPPGSDWELEEVLPGMNFVDPLRVIEMPETDELLILCKQGELWLVSIANQSRSKVLDLADVTYTRGEPGTVGMVLHPEFGNPDSPDKQLMYLFYRTKPNPEIRNHFGYNRLSVFRWDDNTTTFDRDSEEILIQQFDRKSWHNGGGMFFGADGFLYLSLGDEGGSDYEIESTQTLTRGLFSGIIRIDVDNDPSRSHAIRRQPQSNATPPTDWPVTYTQGYSIPNDNPWLDPDGDLLEEFYAIGVRSPYGLLYDQETEQIWQVDVGSDKREEINLVYKGDNLQWPYREGTRDSDVHARPESVIGQERGPFFEYDRSVGFCIIGGGIYRGGRYPELNGKFLFADWTSDRLMALTNTSPNESTTMEVLLGSLDGQPIDELQNGSYTGIHYLSDGHILLTLMGGDGHGTDPGKILRLKRGEGVPEPPSRLSELGAFTNLTTLQPAPGLIPYQVNAPLWSDRATKQRWMAIPNDGRYDAEEEKITFRPTGAWGFPEGTVFVKHFDLPTTAGGPSVRLETRFFIIGQDGQAYGLTYKWNDEGTEAYLLGGGTSREVTLQEGGVPIFNQNWDYPSREQCLSCHNQQAGLVLGVKTHQLNRGMMYPESGQTQNQLNYLNQLGLFSTDIGPAQQYHRSYPLEDETVSLETRIRSYWDSNCASCHRPGGVNALELDLRFETPVKLKKIIQAPTLSMNSTEENTIVEPGDYQSSELWVRDASTGANQMPPLARSIVDEAYVDALAEWIGQLSLDELTLSENVVFPNPSYGQLNIRFSPNWEPPFHLQVINTQGQNVRTITTEEYNNQVFFFDLIPGTYFLRLSDKEHEESKQIIIH